MKKPKHFQKKPEKLLGNETEGLIVALYGASAEVEDASGNIVRCHLRKNSEAVITGDKVLWRPESDGSGVIVDHLPRKSLLARPEHKEKLKPIAANIDAVIIVTAPPPVITEHLIDRYLVAAENLHIQPIILLNKMDLINNQNREEVHRRLGVYEKIGYPIMYSSTLTKHGLDIFEKFLENKNCVLVGQSGVGKSSIIASFVHEQYVRVGETSQKGLGKHTTTMTRLYHLPHGGDLIDSPGVREFGLWNFDRDDILRGFVEFKPFLNNCKFRDCSHLKEPGCHLQKAVESGEIAAQRFESFKEMVALIPPQK